MRRLGERSGHDADGEGERGEPPDAPTTCAREWYALAVPPSDTHPAVEQFIIEGYRKMSPAEKLTRVRELSRAVQELAMANIRRNHPNASERELMLRLASRRLDADTMRRAFGWDPDREGY